MRIAAAVLVFAVVAGSALENAAAQERDMAGDCAATTPPLPVELAGWATPRAGTAKASTGEAMRAPLSVGQAVQLRLLPTPRIRYARPPEKPGSPSSHGGMASFAVTQAGIYRVALGQAAWIDVVRGATASESIAHGHGPVCSGIRKMVDFQLTPGRYLLQISGSTRPTVAAMIVRLR